MPGRVCVSLFFVVLVGAIQGSREISAGFFADDGTDRNLLARNSCCCCSEKERGRTTGPQGEIYGQRAKTLTRSRVLFLCVCVCVCVYPSFFAFFPFVFAPRLQPLSLLTYYSLCVFFFLLRTEKERDSKRYYRDAIDAV